MQHAPESPPPPAIMTQMNFGRWLSQAIGAATQCGYADHLAAGPKTAEELARLTATHGPSVHRLLRALASHGIFVEQEPGRFANTPLSETLRTGVPGSVRGMALFLNTDMHIKAWLGLPYSVQTGKSAFRHIHGMHPFDYFAKHSDVSQFFNDAMTGLYPSNRLSHCPAAGFFMERSYRAS